MTLEEMKKKVLSLIEELSIENVELTDDVDIAAKLNSVINQVQYELARMKKIPTFIKREVVADEVLDLTTLEDFYQLRLLRFSGEYELVENTVMFLDSGEATIFYFKFPKAITDETEDTYEFELSPDALEILPYGVAADLLKSDVSSEYGQVYSQRYETMIGRLDPRRVTESIRIEGGVDI